jgi:hypothetical protein
MIRAAGLALDAAFDPLRERVLLTWLDAKPLILDTCGCPARHPDTSTN